MANASAIQKLQGILSQVRHDSPDPNYRIAAETRDAKGQVISKYGPLFAPENIDQLTAEEFRSFLLSRNNHHWDSIHRQGGVMTADMSRLKETLTILVNERIPIRERLNGLRPSGQEAMVKGLGQAVITAILPVEHPETYGVLNNLAEAGMRAVGLWPTFSWGASFGERYEAVNKVLLDTASQLNIDLWTLDMLWWRAANVDLDTDTETPATPVTEGAFGLEKYLHEFLVDNWPRVELGGEWNLLENEGEIVGSHYPTGEVGEIDLLAKHKAENRWLVVELKRDQTSDATVGQLLRYMGWVRKKLAKDGAQVEGLVVCGDADVKMRYALDGLPNVRCMTYTVSFALTPLPNL